ncbi:MAG: glycosyltransferase family 4 protein [Gemmatimonadota bacterium]
MITVMKPNAMRVLVLAPTTPDEDRITDFSFLDEEIEGLVRAGVEPYVLTPGLDRPEWAGSVHILPVSRENIWAQRMEALALMARHRALLPPGCLRNPSGCIHRVRMEVSIANAVQAHDIDVIHNHFGPFLGLGGVLARAETGVPLVATFRGMDLLSDESIDYGLRMNPSYSAACQALLKFADMTTYASDFMRKEGIRLGADPSRAITIRKGVDLNHFGVARDRATLRAEVGVDRPMILAVGGLIPRKGMDTIIRALAPLKDTHDFTLVVCGKGPERPALERLAGQLGMQDRITFRGYVPRKEIPRYFAACDVFVLASRIEAAGNVILEAMAAGRPVITTDSGGPPEYVRDQQTGYIVPVDDHDVLAERLRLLLDDPALQDELGTAGRKLACEEHQYGRMIQEFVGAYRKAGAGRGHGNGVVHRGASEPQMGETPPIGR